jgi:uncharacterized protein (TIGR02466 family)|tara:strand:- start:1891 stop:2508 length:618 start_codon:yes stop_codon:yes gene_type:complete
MNINKIPIFTQEVFHFTLPNFEEWKKLINQIILVEENKNIHEHDTSPEEACNVMAKRTAWNSHQRYPALNMLCNEIRVYLNKFIEKENYDIPDLDVTDCWINWYKKNQYAQPHKHGGVLSVVLFVDVEKSNSKFFFHSDNNAVFVKKDNVHTNFSNVKELTAKDGTVIFFDGSVFHSVSSNTTDNTRVTVAINFSVNYKSSRNEY